MAVLMATELKVLSPQQAKADNLPLCCSGSDAVRGGG